MALHKHSTRTVRKPCRSCGRSDLYWAHDLERPEGVRCASCDVDGKFTLIERDGSRHACSERGESGVVNGQDGDGRKVPAEFAEFPTVEPTDAELIKAADRAVERGDMVKADAKLAAVAALIDTLSGGQAVDPDEVRRIVKAEIADFAFPTRTVVMKDKVTVKVIEGTHGKLADVTTDVLAGEHVLMVGPAGTGKSTIAEQTAEGLGLDYYSISLSPQTPASMLLGYMQAEGKYVGSHFRTAYEHGGVFHFDEFDNGHPSILAVINGALANGHMAFPDAMVKRHPDFRCMASANTYGRGADRQYVGRQTIDAATLDRFAVETIDIDESLETQLCMATGLDDARVRTVLKFVRKLRANAAKHSMTVVISPRASVGMCKLLNAGRGWDDVVASRARRGLSDSDWTKLSDGSRGE